MERPTQRRRDTIAAKTPSHDHARKTGAPQGIKMGAQIIGKFGSAGPQTRSMQLEFVAGHLVTLWREGRIDNRFIPKISRNDAITPLERLFVRVDLVGVGI